MAETTEPWTPTVQELDEIKTRAQKDDKVISRMSSVVNDPVRTEALLKGPSPEEFAKVKSAIHSDPEAAARFEHVYGKGSVLKYTSDMTHDELRSSQLWRQAAEVISSNAAETDTALSFAFDPETDDPADWLIDYMGQFNHNIVNTAEIGASIDGWSPETKQAFAQAYQLYETLPMVSTEGASQFFQGLASDPTTYVGLGVGKLAAMAAGKIVTKEIAKKAINSAVGQTTIVGMTEGAVFGAGDDIARQNVEVSVGLKDEYSLMQTGRSTAIGTLAGGALAYGGSKILSRFFSKADDGITEAASDIDASIMERAITEVESSTINADGSKVTPTPVAEVATGQPQVTESQPPVATTGDQPQAVSPEAPKGTPEAPVGPTGVLPKDLANAKPRYSYGQNQFDLEFSSDIEKALYIVAQKNPSKRDADYRKFLEDQGYTPEEISTLSKSLKDSIKKQAATSNETVLKVGEHAPRKAPAAPTNTPEQTVNLDRQQPAVPDVNQAAIDADSKAYADKVRSSILPETSPDVAAAISRVADNIESKGDASPEDYAAVLTDIFKERKEAAGSASDDFRTRETAVAAAQKDMEAVLQLNPVKLFSSLVKTTGTRESFIALGNAVEALEGAAAKALFTLNREIASGAKDAAANEAQLKNLLLHLYNASLAREHFRGLDGLALKQAQFGIGNKSSFDFEALNRLLDHGVERSMAISALDSQLPADLSTLTAETITKAMDNVTEALVEAIITKKTTKTRKVKRKKPEKEEGRAYKFQKAIAEWYRNALISAPATWERNLVSGSINILGRGLARDLSMRDRSRYYTAILSNHFEAFEAAKIAFVTEKGVLSLDDKFEEATPAIPGIVGKAVRTFGNKSMQLQDEYLQQTAYRALSYVKAGRFADKQVAEARAANPAMLEKEANALREQAVKAHMIAVYDARGRGQDVDLVKEVQEFVFVSQFDKKNTESGRLYATDYVGKVGEDVLNKLPILRVFLAPFWRPVVRLTEHGIRMTPVIGWAQMATKALPGAYQTRFAQDLNGLNGKGPQAVAKLQASASFAYAGAFMGLYSQGMIIGSDPDYQVDRLVNQEGRRPYSIYNPVSKKWIPLDGLEPFSTPLKVMIAASEAYERSIESTDYEHDPAEGAQGYLEAVGAASMHAGRALLGATYLEGPERLGKIAQSLNDGESGTTANEFYKILAGFIPNNIKAVKDLIDPTMREHSGLIGTLTADVPFMSELVAPRRDPAGRIMEKNPSTGRWNAFAGTENNNDPLVNLWADLAEKTGQTYKFASSKSLASFPSAANIDLKEIKSAQKPNLSLYERWKEVYTEVKSAAYGGLNVDQALLQLIGSPEYLEAPWGNRGTSKDDKLTRAGKVNAVLSHYRALAWDQMSKPQRVGNPYSDEAATKLIHKYQEGSPINERDRLRYLLKDK